MTDTTLDDILTPEEAASFLKMPVKRILALAKRGEIPAKKIGREWRFKASEIVKLFGGWQRNTFDPNRRAGEILEGINGKKKKRV